MVWPDGYEYPFSFTNRFILGRSLLNVLFKIPIKAHIISMFMMIAMGMRLFAINISKTKHRKAISLASARKVIHLNILVFKLAIFILL